MEIEKLKKENFPMANTREPYITFHSNGRIILNKFAIQQLSLLLPGNIWGGVSFFHDVKDPSEISICGDVNGWIVRDAYNGCCVFNNKCLAEHIIDLQWQKIQRPAGDTSKKPDSYSFRIARKPVDDTFHKNIFCLIRKK